MCTSSCFALNHFFHLHYGALIAEVLADVPLEIRRKAFFTSLVRCVKDIPLRGEALYDELVTCSFPVRPTIPGSYLQLLHGNARKSDKFAVDARTMSSSISHQLAFHTRRRCFWTSPALCIGCSSNRCKPDRFHRTAAWRGFALETLRSF